jgi:FkbM family methyltransferase
MTFLSYAQNFEDVMLWRALKGVARGFYIDVGAQHPDDDSVTRAFYDRGWSGINIEPVAESARRIAAARLRDVTLPVALGEEAGAAEFFVVEGTGLSTAERGSLAAIDAAGFSAEQTTVAMTTLAAVCRDHAPADIHFLKIDVEGGEASVLRGADFAQYRPWIVLVEATAPMASDDTSAAWEPMLLQAGYEFVWFDGLNRFYVAQEHFAALAPSFRLPPNVFDDFLRMADTEFARRVAQAQAEAAANAAQAAEAGRAFALARARGEEIARLQQLLLAMQTELAATLRAAEAARAEASEANAWLAATRASTSWRATAPMRLATSLLARRRAPPAMPPEADSIPEQPPEPAPAPEPQAAAPEPPAPQPLAPPAAVAHQKLRRAVHQFHSGSAVGDAITNAMLLTRRLLRQLGYASEIFVEHPDPLLGDAVRPMAALPEHDEYVLIVRHSMGYGAYDRIRALNAPKILIYHNITPAEFLVGAPVLQHWGQVGRNQLAGWRDGVLAALADSEFNAIELRRLGFDGAQACTLLFDLAALRARAATKSQVHRSEAFTILFVSRVSPHKGQAELVDAYARFRACFAPASRLVLVGRADGNAEYVERLRETILAKGLTEHVVLTGLVADDDLHAWYDAADLYVSLSRHEGFGVPLVEAMAHDVPVLALPTGAIPYTLGGAGELLADAAPDTVAAAMLALAQDGKRRVAQAERQRRSLDRFALERQIPVLVQALAHGGAAQPPDRAARVALSANIRFTVAGHVNKTYSLAAINRTLALTLEAERPGRVRLCPVEGQPTADLSDVPEEVRPRIALLAERARPDTGPELVISQHYPVFVPDEPGDVCVAMLFWEESLLPEATIATLNRSFRAVLAPTRFVAKALVDSGLSIPVRVTGFPPDLSAVARLTRRAPADAEAFTFLHVSSGFPRKGVDVLLAAFARAFRATDNVRLVIKVFPNPHNDIAGRIERLRRREWDMPEIVLVDRDMAEPEMLHLYGEADAVVLPTRGEGFNIPAAEAMAAGIPLIVTGFGGQTDFATDKTARLIDYRFAPSGSHLATPHSLWVEPDEDDLVAALREAVADRASGLARAEAARRAVGALQDRAGFVRRLTDTAIDLLLMPPPGRVRIGWVSSWQVRCGIAGYSEALLAALPGDDPITLFCDERTDADAAGARGAVRRCWRLGDADSVSALATTIAAADPQVLMIQHQPALLPWDALATLLRSRAVAARPVAVTLHNTRHLMDIAADARQAALDALGGVARVLVHTLADVNFLKDLGLIDNVTLLPHGTPAAAAGEAPRALTPADAPLIACYGFFLPGKGIGALIEAADILRRTWPHLRLRLVNADYGTPESASEIAACRALAEARGAPVEWHCDFLPDAESRALLADADIVALPYGESKEASSAALRTALSAGGVVAVTGARLFDEAAEAVFRLPGFSSEDIAAGLDTLLNDAALRARVQQGAAAWLAARRWDDIGRRLHGMLTGLAHG